MCWGILDQQWAFASPPEPPKTEKYGCHLVTAFHIPKKPSDRFLKPLLSPHATFELGLLGILILCWFYQ